MGLARDYWMLRYSIRSWLIAPIEIGQVLVEVFSWICRTVLTLQVIHPTSNINWRLDGMHANIIREYITSEVTMRKLRVTSSLKPMITPPNLISLAEASCYGVSLVRTINFISLAQRFFVEWLGCELGSVRLCNRCVSLGSSSVFLETCRLYTCNSCFLNLRP